MNHLVLILGLIFFINLTFFPASLRANPKSIQIGKAQKPLQTITLTDGTSIKGRVLAIEEGYYIIETDHIGQVKVHVTNLNSIVTTQNKPQQKLLQSPLNLSSLMQPPLQSQNAMGINLQNLLMDPQMNANIQTLLTDPEIVNLLNDEELLEVLFSLDIQRIQSHPKFQKLLEHPQMKKIINQTGQNILPQQLIRPIKP